MLTIFNKNSNLETERRYRRSKLFVAVSMVIGDKPTTARLRDISPVGALVEMRDPPPRSTFISLVRGNMTQNGQVKWAKGNRCGISFDDEIIVLDWLSGKPNNGQAGVDDLIAAMKSGIGFTPPHENLLDNVEAINAVLDYRISEEIDFALRSLEDFVGTLAQDQYIVAKYTKGLQRVDETSAILREISGIIRANERASAAMNCILSSLKARLLRN